MLSYLCLFSVHRGWQDLPKQDYLVQENVKSFIAQKLLTKLQLLDFGEVGDDQYIIFNGIEQKIFFKMMLRTRRLLGVWVQCGNASHD